MKIVVLYDKPIGQKILEIVTENKEDEIIAKTPDEFNTWDQEMAVNGCPKWLREFAPDWLITAWWPKLLSQGIIGTAKHTLNTHNSYLPWCKGKHPNFWHIMEEIPYGVSLHEISSEIDGGGIYAQDSAGLAYLCGGNWHKGQTLYDEGLKGIVELFRKSWPYIRDGRWKANPQYPGSGSFHYAKELEPKRTIDLDKCYSARELFKIIRAAECNGYYAHFKDGMEEYNVELIITKRP